VTRSTFRSNRARTVGGGLAASNSQPSISHCVFASNSAASGGGVALLAHCRAALWNVTAAYNNASVAGGGLYAQDILSGSLDGASVLSNNQAANGGGAALQGVGAWTIGGNTSFVLNTARSGGAVYWDKLVPAFDRPSNALAALGGTPLSAAAPAQPAVYFSGNTAPHGADVASQPKTVRFDPTAPLSFDVTSGQALFNNISVYLFDAYNQSVVVDSTTVLTPVAVDPTPDVTFFGTSSATVSGGQYTFNTAAAPFGVIRRPSSTASFAVRVF
jgi:hypothetical protein